MEWIHSSSSCLHVTYRLRVLLYFMHLQTFVSAFWSFILDEKFHFNMYNLLKIFYIILHCFKLICIYFILVDLSWKNKYITTFLHLIIIYILYSKLIRLHVLYSHIINYNLMKITLYLIYIYIYICAFEMYLTST